jgi:thiazole tautomerase (transcriptional regulator TenI)
VTSLPVVHAVTSDEVIARGDFLDRALSVMRTLGARGAIHLRAAAATSRHMYSLAAALAAAQDTTGAWLVVNDRVDIALASGARAIQLTSRSIDAADTMRALRATAPGTPHPALGLSVHSAAEARAAGAGDGISWLVVGHVFETPSHAGEPARGATVLHDVCAATTLPVIAIGGVRPEHVAALLADGAYGVAVIRGIWRADDAESAAAEYLSAYDAVPHAGPSGGA